MKTPSFDSAELPLSLRSNEVETSQMPAIKTPHMRRSLQIDSLPHGPQLRVDRPKYEVDDVAPKGLWIKRSLDVTIAALLLLVFAVPMLVITVLVKRSSPGPVFYRQRRVGRDGKPFELFKFRTMRVDAEEQTGPVWARECDPRCTHLGGRLRAMSLDELPQLINVLRGEMSLVGPRPERPFFVEKFSRELPDYALRHAVMPGLTGWAQVNGWRGNTSIERRLEHDLHYIRHRSLWLDLKILAVTPWVMFRGSNAY
jgi:exopolysaccharide biosynthesis polyprenyl glycosylphosphotransferase